MAQGPGIERLHVGRRLSEVAIAGGTVYLAGQVPENEPEADIEGQTREVLGHIDRLLTDSAGEAPLTALHEAFTEQFTLESALTSRTRALLAREHPALHRAYLASFAAFEDDLTAAMARRTGLDPHKDAYPRLVVAVALTAMRTAATHAIDLGRTADMPALIDGAFAAIATGLTPPQAPPAA